MFLNVFSFFLFHLFVFLSFMFSAGTFLHSPLITLDFLFSWWSLLSWSAQYRSNSLSLLFLLLYLLKKQKQIRIYSMMPVGFTWYNFSFRMKSTAAPKSLMSTHMTYTLYYTSFMLYDALCEQQTQIKVTHCNKYVRSCMAKHPFLNIKFKNAWLTFQCFHWEIYLSVPHIKIAYIAK